MRALLARIPRTAMLAILALLAGFLAAIMLALHVKERVQQIEDRSRLDMVERIVAARDLPAGTRLSAEHLAVRSFPSRWVGSDTLPVTRHAELEGRVLAVSLNAGDALVPAHAQQVQTAFSQHLAPGRRAITLPVDQVNSLSGLLQPGDLIDLYVSFDYQRKRITAPLLQGVLVLATGRETLPAVSGADGAYPGHDASYSSLTLDAAPEDVIRLVAARQAGTLTAILRHPHDDQPDRRAARGDLASLLGLSVPAPKPARRAVVLYGSSSARALPAWARPGRQGTQAVQSQRNGWFEMPAAQALSSSWMHAVAEADMAEAHEPFSIADDWSGDTGWSHLLHDILQADDPAYTMQDTGDETIPGNLQ